MLSFPEWGEPDAPPGRASGGRRRAGFQRSFGFTLVELLVVVAILALLAGVAVVQLLRARITTDEQLAITSARFLATSSQMFFLNQQAYPTALTDLGAPASVPPYVQDALLLAGDKQGYHFTYTPEPGPTPVRFALRADPHAYGGTGVRHFYIDETMVLRATGQDRDATAADPPVSP